MSDVNNRYHSALDALDIYQDISERLRAKEKLVTIHFHNLQLHFFQHKENSVVLFDELSIVQDKVEYFRKLMGDNDQLLGNFSAQRIHAISEAKSSVTSFVQGSSANLAKISDQSKRINN